jgi:hypothetical protein
VGWATGGWLGVGHAHSLAYRMQHCAFFGICRAVCMQMNPSDHPPQEGTCGHGPGATMMGKGGSGSGGPGAAPSAMSPWPRPASLPPTSAPSSLSPAGYPSAGTLRDTLLGEAWGLRKQQFDEGVEHRWGSFPFVVTRHEHEHDANSSPTRPWIRVGV